MLFFCTVTSGLAAAAPTGTPPVTGADVIGHLEETIAWYRSVTMVERSAALANDVLLRETAHRTSTEALQRGFAFARAQAGLLGTDPLPAAASSGAGRTSSGLTVEQLVGRAKERVTKLELRLGELDTPPKASRAIHAARRKQVLAELNLARQIEDSIKGMAAFMGSVGARSNGLSSRIDQLERSVPEVMSAGRQPAQASAQPAANTAPFHAESAGLFGLATELFTLARARTQLKHLIEQTDELLKSAREVRGPLSGELRAAIRRSDAIEAESASSDPEQLASGYREIESLSSRFKQLSATLAPLREQGILIETSRGNLAEWRNTVDARYASIGGYLLMRCAVLAAAVCMLILISVLWRRMAFRYAREARRRRQILVLRRVAVTAAIVLIVVLGLVSELGSLATYAGFLTAGLAVALQAPILSVVAYFLLIGRYGLRVGDRVTISGVTGDVIEIGLVRLYVMELEGRGTDLHPTGRIVAFSNSVLLQPAALFKQMPGTDYVWRTVRMVLAGECNAQIAEKKLMAAVDGVYDEYRETIDQQHALFERSVDMKMAAPQPQGHVRFTESGLEFSANYPVEMRRGPAIDARILQALQETVANEPALALARSGEPRLVEAT